MASREPTMIKLHPNSVVAFGQAVMFADEHLLHEAPKILELATVSYVRGARNVTPQARKNAKRKVVRLTKSRKKFPRFGVIKLTQSKPPQVIPVTQSSVTTIREAKQLPIADFRYKGAAKNSWWGILRSLGKTVAKPEVDVARGRHIGSRVHPAIELVNKLVYLLKIAPDVDKEGRRRAAKDIAIKTEMAIERAWK